MMETEAELTYRIEALPRAMQFTQQTAGILSLRRARLHWHRRMGCRSGAGPGHRAPVRLGASHRHNAWYHGGAMPTTGASPPEHPSWTARRPPGSPVLLPGISLLRPAGQHQEAGKAHSAGIDRHLASSRRGWRTRLGLLTLVATYPVGAVAHYQGLAGENPEGAKP